MFRAFPAQGPGTDDFRRGSTGHGRGSHDDVNVSQVLGQSPLLLGALLAGQFPRVTALALRRNAEVEELATERLDLLTGFRTHVESLDLRTKPARGRDRLQPGNARADDQHA